MPQKGLKRDDGVWGRREKTFLKSFSLLPRSQINLYLETKNYDRFCNEKTGSISFLLNMIFLFC